MSSVKPKSLEILIAEDDPSDIRLMRKTLQDCGHHKINVNVVTDGEEALQFLRREAQFAAAPRPQLIFLDLNMPKKNGCEVMIDIKNDDSLKQIPVIVFTTSNAERDILASYSNHCSAFITKPGEFSEFKRIINGIMSFWLEIASLPPSLD